eukprot:2256352-Pyramimonas_sp.AAC.1
MEMAFLRHDARRVGHPPSATKSAAGLLYPHAESVPTPSLHSPRTRYPPRPRRGGGRAAGHIDYNA